MYIIFQRSCGWVVSSLDNASTLPAMWLLSRWAIERPGSAAWPAINTAMSSCLNGPGPDRGWETHNGEQRPSRCCKRGGGESSRQQGQHDTKSIICFRANKPATVHLRLSNLEEEKRKDWAKILLPVWAWLPLSDLLLFPFFFFLLKSNWKQAASMERINSYHEYLTKTAATLKGN